MYQPNRTRSNTCFNYSHRLRLYTNKNKLMVVH